MKKLFVIGNGFDRYHKMDSSYSDFRKYLEIRDKELLKKLEEFFGHTDLWSNLESALAEFDADQLSVFLTPYGDDDWSDASHDDYRYEINKVVKLFSRTLKARFIDWISGVKIPSRASLTNKLTYIDVNAIYLNFNYTSTLQKIYLVPDKNICHIHGKVETEIPNLILGHAWIPSKEPSLNTNEEYDGQDIRVIEGNKIIEEYFKLTYKPTTEIIKANKNYFRRLNSIEVIYVLGHSMSAVDMPYFYEIANSINRNVTKWHVSYHTHDDLVECQRTMHSLSIKESLIHYSKIESIGMQNPTLF